MGLKKIVLNILLSFINFFVKRRPIIKNRIAFVSLESETLQSDMKQIYDALNEKGIYDLKTVLINYNNKSLRNQFRYMLNCMKQIAVINTSTLVLITDNNYVISNHKRKGVKVLQIWHAAGAIKKFGNAIKRKYPIRNYDYVIANSPYWKEPYHEAFGVDTDQVMVTGMPRVDHLVDREYLETTRNTLLNRYPQLVGKRILLYAPTFRGDIYSGFTAVPFNPEVLMNNLDDNTVLIYKFHPLMNTTLKTNDRIINMNHEDTHDLFTISDCLISDFSSIIFDYSLLEKPMYFFVPDLDDYLKERGCFVDYRKTMPGSVCMSEEELALAIKENKEYDVRGFKKTFFSYDDGHNLLRVIELIEDIVNV